MSGLSIMVHSLKTQLTREGYGAVVNLSDDIVNGR